MQDVVAVIESSLVVRAVNAVVGASKSICWVCGVHEYMLTPAYRIKNAILPCQCTDSQV